MGVVDGEPMYTLYRVVGAERLSDGRIVIGNGETAEVRFYDAVGRFVQAVGREGSGPGEFRGLNWVGRFAGDSVAVWDYTLARWTVIGPEGNFARVAALSPLPSGMFPRVVGVLDDGSFLLAPGWNVNALASGGEGIRRDSLTWLRYGPDGVFRDTVAQTPGKKEFVKGTGGAFSTNPVPFGRQTFVAVAGNRVWLGDNDRWVPEARNPAGEALNLIERQQAPRHVTDGDVDRYKRERLSRITVDSYRELQEQVLREVPFHRTMPAFSGLLVDAGGSVWVREYSPFSGDPHVWLVLSPEGETLGRVTLPGNLEVLSVGHDYILARELDEDEVERVVLHRFSRSDRVEE